MRKLVILLIAFLLISCTKAPDCHNEIVKKTAVELAPKLLADKFESVIPMINPLFTLLIDKNEIKKAVNNEVSKFNYSIRNSRIDSYNEKVDKYFCSAELIMSSKDNPEEEIILHIIYTSQLVDNGNKLYVTLKLSDEEELKFFQEFLKLKFFILGGIYAKSMVLYC